MQEGQDESSGLLHNPCGGHTGISPSSTHFKVSMPEGMTSRNPGTWVVAHQFLKEVNACSAYLIECVANIFPTFWLPLWEGWLEVWQLRKSWPHSFGWCPQFLEDLEGRVDFRVAGKEWSTSCHLSKDAPDTPHVNRDAVQF